MQKQSPRSVPGEQLSLNSKRKKYKESTKDTMMWHMEQKVIKYNIKLLS